MSSSPPRLTVNEPNAAAVYAPISWMAVGSAAVGMGFLLLTALLAYSASARKQPLLESWLLAVAAIAVVLAFVARRQIAASEGTLVGEKYANFGWWIGVVGFLGYSAYLTAIEFSFRREVDTAFRANWVGPLENINLLEYKNQALYNAAYLTLPPLNRKDLNRNDAAGIERRFEGFVIKFRNTDLVRLANRNRGNIKFSNETIRDWSMKGDAIECTLAVTVTTPEGEAQAVIPMIGQLDERKLRQWQMIIPDDGYIKQNKRTLYGWWIEYLEASGGQFAERFLFDLGTPGKQGTAYLGFIAPDSDPAKAELFNTVLMNTAPGRGAIGGGVSYRPIFLDQGMLYPLPPDWEKHLTEKIFAKTSGVRLTPDEQRTFMYNWYRGRSYIKGGILLKALNDNSNVLVIQDHTIQLRVPFEMVLGQDPNRPTAARGVITLEQPPEEVQKVKAELENAKAAGSVIVPAPPESLKLRPTNWRIIRIESDFQMRTPPMDQKAGPPGGGMMG